MKIALEAIIDAVPWLRIETVILLLLLSASLCAAADGDIGGGVGTPGVANTYVALDMDFGSEYLGAAGCVITVPLISGDTIEVTATTANPADFIGVLWNHFLFPESIFNFRES